MATTSKLDPNYKDKGKMIKLGGQNDFETGEEEGDLKIHATCMTELEIDDYLAFEKLTSK
nr:hypothetical protein [Tanacetum cinerariifolium]